MRRHAAGLCLALGAALLLPAAQAQASVSTAHSSATSSPSTALSPRTLPAGDHLYAITCNAASAADYHLFRVHPASGAFVSVGGTTSIEGSTCAYAMSYDAATKVSYFLAGNTTAGTLPLLRVNLTTGRERFIADLMLGATKTTGFPAVVAIGNQGKAFAIVGNSLYRLNLTTGALAVVGPVGSVGDVYSFSVDPANGLFYAIDEPGHVYRIDTKTGAGTLLGRVSTVNSRVYSLTIDTKGVFWINEAGSPAVDNPNIGSFVVSRIATSLIPSSRPMPFYSGAFEIAH